MVYNEKTLEILSETNFDREYAKNVIDVIEYERSDADNEYFIERWKEIIRNYNGYKMAEAIPDVNEKTILAVLDYDMKTIHKYPWLRRKIECWLVHRLFSSFGKKWH